MPFINCTYIPDIPIIFPLPHYAHSASWETRQNSEYWRQVRPSGFGHARPADKRTHAAVDLYAAPGTIVMAIADGVVVDSARSFQSPPLKDETPGNAKGTVTTVAIAVEHPGLGIVRYCELDPNLALGIMWRANVKQGQILGRVGFQGAKYVGTGDQRTLVAAQTMLHLEWYSDWTDNHIDPNPKHDDAGRPHVLSQPPAEYFVHGKKTQAPANQNYDNFPDGSSFQRRHDLIDLTQMIMAAPVTTLKAPPLKYHFATKPTPPITDLAPSLAYLLRRATVRAVASPHKTGE